MEIIREINGELIKNLLKQGKRADGRGKLQYRKIEVEKNVIDNAEGSALCRLGNTQVLAAVKIGLAAPFPDRPDEGVLSTSAEFTPIAASHFEPGPPSIDSIELARVVDRGIRSSEIVDLKKLTTSNPELVKAIYLDLWIIDYDGNLFDASTIAAVVALKNTYLPKLENDKLIYEERVEKLQTKACPISCTFGKIENHIILDPTFDEEISLSPMITITTTSNHVCAVQKSKGGGFSKNELLELVDLAFEKGQEIRQLLDLRELD
ncbi:MAG: exosome complex protein Rrp42 [Candidatus Micrarchaeota archaeon]|nr:exosome complex protein Rrp42 [Candidatus Micrarchaeota archaeon]